MKLPALTELAKYTNPHVFQRYEKDFPHNQLKAEEAFAELVKYFWLCKKHQQDLHNFPDNENLKLHCAIYIEMKEIDDMWHTFLLFTKDYMKFCRTYFGSYMHHNPNVDEKPMPIDIFETEFSRYLAYIYDNLGEDTVKKWFDSLLD